MAEGARLESVYTATYRGFESLSLRHIINIINKLKRNPARFIHPFGFGCSDYQYDTLAAFATFSCICVELHPKLIHICTID